MEVRGGGLECLFARFWHLMANDDDDDVSTGLSPDLQSMEQIRRIMRPTDVPDQGICIT